MSDPNDDLLRLACRLVERAEPGEQLEVTVSEARRTTVRVHHPPHAEFNRGNDRVRGGGEVAANLARLHQLVFIQPFAVPQFARDLFVPGIECFAIVRVETKPHILAEPQAHLQEPVRIREGLPGGSDDVGFAISQNTFCFGEPVNATGRNDRRI